VTDSTGIKFLGDGALSWSACKALPGNKWQARKHGVQRRRQWRKVHLAMAQPRRHPRRGIQVKP